MIRCFQRSLINWFLKLPIPLLISSPSPSCQPPPLSLAWQDSSPGNRVPSCASTTFIRECQSCRNKDVTALRCLPLIMLPPPAPLPPPSLSQQDSSAGNRVTAYASVRAIQEYLRVQSGSASAMPCLPSGLAEKLPTAMAAFCVDIVEVSGGGAEKI